MKVAIITGGNRGVGKSTALSAAKRGIGVILAYKPNERETEREAEEVVADIKASGGKAFSLPLDVSRSELFVDFAKQIAARLKNEFNTETFDYLVNNAGIAQRSPIRETTEKEVDDLFQIHFKGPFFLSQKLEPLMADGGQIINISSGLAKSPRIGTAVYGAMKSAIEVLTVYQAQEFANRKIRVNCVAPGPLDTQFGGGRTNEDRQMIAGLTPFGRIGRADDIGPMIVHLMSDETQWMTGQTIGLSGGQVL